MAIIKATEAPVNLGSNIALPRDRYIIRCTAEEFGPSKSSGNPMITRTWEIVSPESIMIDGKKVIIAGTEIKRYNTLEVIGDQAKTLKAVGSYLADNAKLGLPSAEVDTENPELLCEGVCAHAILSSEEQVTRKALTDEERAEGKKFGEAIKDQEGNELKRYNHRIEQILGVAVLEANQQY